MENILIEPWELDELMSEFFVPEYIEKLASEVISL